MEIFMNQNKIDATLDTEKNLKDVLMSLQSYCEENDATITNYSVNGENVAANQIDEYNKMQIEDINKLCVSTIAKKDITETLLQFVSQIEQIEEDLQNVSVNMQTGKDKAVYQSVIKLSDLLDNFFKTISLTSFFPEDFCALKIADKNIAEFLSDFEPVLKDFEQAITQKDSVLLGDLAEYEILPRIQQMKTFCKTESK